VDHDLAQRMLTARSAWRGGLSLLAAQCVSVCVVSLFLAVGLLLYIFYRRPDVMGAAAPVDALHDTTGGMGIYPQFLLAHMPTGLAGLAIAGMFAAAQGSLDSAINAMASSAVSDLYWPIRKNLGYAAEKDGASATPRVAVAITGVVLIGFAVVSALRYDPKHQSLLSFALSVMFFAYTGMLGVFLTAILTPRGNTLSVLLALLTGVIATTLQQDEICRWWTKILFGHPHALTTFWSMPIGTIAAFAVCVAGAPRLEDGTAPR
jgi:Na+/proline symporter